MQEWLFDIAEIQDLRRRAEKASLLPADPTEGWTVSAVDPMELLGVFRRLHLKDGYVLRAYQYFSAGNGNAVVWALPKDAPFPEPDPALAPVSDVLDDVPGVLLTPAQPADALDSIGEVLDGDGSPEAYMEASLFVRELMELGASCHGMSWSGQSILGADPWEEVNAGTFDSRGINPTPREQWEWPGGEPSEWRPRHSIYMGGCVMFYIYDPIGQESICWNLDRYGIDQYWPDGSFERIGTGPGGVIP